MEYIILLSLDWINHEKVKVPGKPIQLIKENDKGELELVHDTLNKIKGLEGSVAIGCVVGPYRSGKSFIASLLLNKSNAFELGSTVKSCTRGIWMYDTPIKHRNKNGEFNLILLDTEGLGSPDAKAERDNKIFVLSLLLSSMFVYNTTRVIDRQAIQKLAVMNNLSNVINSGINNTSIDETNKSSIIKNSPDFIWALRDTFLSLNGQTPKEYLLSSLELETVEAKNKDEIEECNFIRESIKSSFKSLDCFCLPSPIDGGINGMSFEETLRSLDKIDQKWLKPDFIGGIDSLCKSIKTNICPKSVFGTPLSAPAYSNYIENVFEQLNKNNKIISLTESLTSSIKYSSEMTLTEAIDNYTKKMTEFFIQYPMPVKWETLEETNRQVMESSYKLLNLNLNGTNELTKPFIDSFTNKIFKYEDGNRKLVGGLFNTYRLNNSKQIKDYNKKQLNKLWKKNIVDVYFNRNESLNNANRSKFYERL